MSAASVATAGSTFLGAGSVAWAVMWNQRTKHAGSSAVGRSEGGMQMQETLNRIDELWRDIDDLSLIHI